MFTNEIRPYKSNTDHREKTGDALRVAQMCVLDVEAGGFQGAERCLNLPTHFICRNTLVGAVEADENLKFRHPVGILDAASGKIDVFALVDKELVIGFLLPDLERVEQPPCADFLAGGRLYEPEVLSYADVISYSVAVEPSDPVLAYKLPVGHKTVDTFMAKQPDESLHNIPALLPVGVPSFRHKAEYQREGYSFVCHAKHENVDVEVPELPVGAVHAQHQTFFGGQQREYHPCHNVEAEGVMRDEPLNASQVGIPFHRRRHSRGKFVEAHSLHHTQGMKHKSHQLYAGKIHRISKMLLHNREDLANFDQVLGVSNLHEKAANFSLKLLNSKDFYKCKQLIIRCLTA